MPTYTYEVLASDGTSVGRVFEIEQKMSDPALATHPESGEPVRRIITGGGGLLLGKGSANSGAGLCGSGACEPAQQMSACCGGGCRGH